MSSRRSMLTGAGTTRVEPSDGEYRVEGPTRGVINGSRGSPLPSVPSTGTPVRGCSATTPVLITTWVSGRIAPSVAEAMRFDFAAASLRAHGAAPAKLAAFHDWESITGYEGDSRAVLHGLLADGLETFGSTHVLLGASLVGMGITVAASLLGKRVRCYVRREPWEQALAAWLGTAPR